MVFLKMIFLMSFIRMDYSVWREFFIVVREYFYNIYIVGVYVVRIECN